jgi:hypothetical protein
VKEEVSVGFVQLPHVVVHRPWEIAVEPGPLAQPAANHLGRRLQVDNEIRVREVGHEQIVQALIDEQLVVVEIQVCVDLVALEEIVADDQLAEEV